MTSEEKTCVFCDSECELSRNGFNYNYYCQTCGGYSISRTAVINLKNSDNLRNLKINCIYENIKATDEGLRPYWVYSRDSGKPKVDPVVIIKYVSDYEGVQVDHKGKPENLLKVLSLKLRNCDPFQKFSVNDRDMHSVKIGDKSELVKWINVLVKRNYIEVEDLFGIDRVSEPEHLQVIKFNITPDGWEKVSDFFSITHSTKAFIALSFNNEERPNIQKSIESACDKTGWEGFTIDQTEYLGGITDEIIGAINQSRFIVADFTKNNAGVYYESGYAAGKNIPVIYTVKESEVGDLHFDTRHINHIVWENYDELEKKLINRINAVINR